MKFNTISYFKGYFHLFHPVLFNNLNFASILKFELDNPYWNNVDDIDINPSLEILF